MKTRWPWISLLLTALAILNPLGIDFLRDAFWGTQLSRSIAQPIALMALGVLSTIVFAEWWMRHTLIRRARARGQV
jgi:hypothetical protein